MGYAKVTKEVTVALAACGECHVLYTWLDGEIGGTDWTRTCAKASRQLGWQSRTAYKHATHLKELGLIQVRHPGGRKSAELRLRHQPERGLVNPRVKLRKPAAKKKQARPKFLEAPPGNDDRKRDSQGRFERVNRPFEDESKEEEG